MHVRNSVLIIQKQSHSCFNSACGYFDYDRFLVHHSYVTVCSIKMFLYNQIRKSHAI